LQGLHRILIPGGKAYISVPDLDTLCRIFVSPEMAVPERTGDRIQVMRKIFGGQLDAYDYHYVGLNLDFLLAFLRDAGFHSVEQVEHFGLFDDASDLTIDGVPISLNLIAEKAA
jgi:predicted SAM-dependent methyltransferase